MLRDINAHVFRIWQVLCLTVMPTWRMKNLMILGGMIGFVGSGILGWMAREETLWLLVKASLATCAGGLMLRWWGQLWLSSLKVAVREEMAQETIKTDVSELKRAEGEES